MPEVQLGMIPAAGGSQTLPANAGPSVALDLLLTGRRFDAETARRYKLISRVTPPEALAQTAWDIAGQLAALPAGFASAARTALREGAELSLVAGLQMEQRLAAMQMDAAVD